MTMGKRQRKEWIENDAYSRFWRASITSFQRPGYVKKIKRRTHKRERRDGRKATREE